MIKIQRIGHATLETPDLRKTLEYFVSLNGFVIAYEDKACAHLASKLGQLTLTLERSERADCSRLSFEVAPDSDFHAMAKYLSNEGIASEIRADPFPGAPEALTFTDFNGTKVDLFKSWSFLTGNQNVAGIGPLKIGHICFFVPDIRATVAYYERILGFKVSDWLGDFFVFMRCNPDHHTVNFFTGPKTAIHHMAFELKDFAHMQHSCEALAMARIPIGWGPMRHGPGHNLATYHRNPDHHVVEYYCELDQMKNEDLGYFEPRPWHVDRPQRPKIWEAGKWTSGWGTPPAPSHIARMPENLKALVSP